MKLFIESASLEAVEDALDVGAVDGVVLGAAASRQAAKALRGLVDKLVDLAVGPIVIEVAVGTVEEMLSRGREMAGLGDEIVLGLPFTREGLEVCRTCFDEGLATLDYSADQDLLSESSYPNGRR